MSFTPSDEQAAAIRDVVAWYKGGSSTPQVFYLAGYAGAGKSTVFRLVLEELYANTRMQKHALATFTGKAAAVLRKKGNLEAQTIHSLIYIMDEEAEQTSNGDLKFQLNIYGGAAEVDLIALDECSMVNDEMGADVLSFGKKVLVMGDPGQLPPVSGEGFFTRMTPDVFLREVHRQALESPILRLATRARQGEPIPFGEVGEARVLQLTGRTQLEAFREDTQTLCGVHRVRKVVTSKIRHARGFGGTLPMAGEPILCGKNNRERRLYNGQQGILLSEPKAYTRRDGDDVSMNDLIVLDVHMDDHAKPLRETLAHPYMFQDHFGEVEKPRMKKTVEWFDWGYLLTVHKAQGSEWPDVTVIDDSGSFRDDRHRWLYTAITRASERLTILRR